MYKYFPNNSILKAKENPRDSYIWKSIIEIKDNLLKGCCWRIGNGMSKKVWKDPWLPYQDWFKFLN